MEVKGDLCHQLLKSKIKPIFNYKENNNYELWKEQIKSKFIELLEIDKIHKNACPLNIDIEEEKIFAGYKRIRFTFESEKGAIVPCYLLIPNTGKEQYPLAITLQGHTTGFHNSIGVLKYEEDEELQPKNCFALQAVAHGYAALAIEQRGMGERRPIAEHQVGAHMCEYEAHIALLLGRTILGERVWDISKAIDVMSEFPQIDTGKILITGHSGGGTASYYGACFDDRIKLCVPSCSVCTYPDSIINYYHCSCNFIPHAYEWFDMQDLACLIAPRPLVMIAGREDRIFPLYGVKKGFETIEKIYAKVGERECCKLIETPQGHLWCENIVWEQINLETKKLGW